MSHNLCLLKNVPCTGEIDTFVSIDGVSGHQFATANAVVAVTQVAAFLIATVVALTKYKHKKI